MAVKGMVTACRFCRFVFHRDERGINPMARSAARANLAKTHTSPERAQLNAVFFVLTNPATKNASASLQLTEALCDFLVTSWSCHSAIGSTTPGSSEIINPELIGMARPNRRRQ